MPLTSLGHSLWQDLEMHMENHFITGIAICRPRVLTAGMPTK